MTEIKKNNRFVVIARPHDNGLPVTKVEASLYMDGDREVVANASADGITPTFTGGDTKINPVHDRKVAIEEAGFKQMGLVGNCPGCKSDLYTSHSVGAELAADLVAKGDETACEIHCPKCGETASMDLSHYVEALAEEASTETEEEASEEETEEAAEEGEEEASEDEGESEEESAEEDEGEEAAEEEEGEEEASEDEEESAADDSDEDDAGDDDSSEDDPDADEGEDDEEEDDGEEDPDEDEGDEDEGEDDGEEEDSSEEEAADEVTASEEESEEEAEEASVEDEELEEAASEDEVDTIALDVAATTNFDENTTRVVPVRQGLMAVFVEEMDTGNAVNIGNLHLESASDANRSLLAKVTVENLKTLNKAVIAAMKSNDNMSALGFKPTVHQVEVASFVNDRVEAEMETASTKTAESIEAYKAEFAQAIATAAAGMNKGFFESPLTASLTDHLTRRRVQNPRRVAEQVVSSSASPFMTAVLKKATELMGKDTKTREELASLIKGAQAGSVVVNADNDLGNTAEEEMDMASVANFFEEEPKATKKEVKNNSQKTVGNGSAKKRMFRSVL